MVKSGRRRRGEGPLLVFGPRSTAYDFGEGHPLTPRRFGPGIDLLRAVGAEPGLTPEPAPDEDLLLGHTERYLAAVRRLSADPWGPPEAGIGPAGDNPSFAGMHEAGAAVAGGSVRAMEAILRGDVVHAFHPGGGLHHAMPDRASGFCIYDDPALAIALARRRGLRVLYVDLDVHHGDGVQAIHWSDPGVVTISIHESGRYLFPGTGFAGELGEGAAAGTAVNVPLEPGAGDEAWSTAVGSIVPALAAAFGPDVVVSQHGSDSHGWDPLAHLRVTTTAMGEAARLVDRIAHRWAGGRWLSTGGGGYDAYRVVPRAWAHVWLAGAHREPPAETPDGWRSRWDEEAARHGQWPLPLRFDDPPNAGLPEDELQVQSTRESVAQVGAVCSALVPQLLLASLAERWWSPLDPAPGGSEPIAPPATPSGTPTILERLDAAALARLRLAPRVVPPAEAGVGRELLGRVVGSGGVVTAAIVDDVIVGAGVVAGGRLLALGVAPDHRRRGVGGALLRRLVDAATGPLEATVTVAERDPVEPLERTLRAAIARRLLEGAGFEVHAAGRALASIDSLALSARRG